MRTQPEVFSEAGRKLTSGPFLSFYARGKCASDLLCPDDTTTPARLSAESHCRELGTMQKGGNADQKARGVTGTTENTARGLEKRCRGY